MTLFFTILGAASLTRALMRLFSRWEVPPC